LKVAAVNKCFAAAAIDYDETKTSIAEEFYPATERVMLPVICPNARRFWAKFAACSGRTRQMLDRQNCQKVQYFRGLGWWRTQLDANRSPCYLG
jgi:hypothetical protein